MYVNKSKNICEIACVCEYIYIYIYIYVCMYNIILYIICTLFSFYSFTFIGLFMYVLVHEYLLGKYVCTCYACNRLPTCWCACSFFHALLLTHALYLRADAHEFRIHL